MTYTLLGEEVIVTDLQNEFGEIAMDINLYGETIRFIAFKQGNRLVIERDIIVNPGTPKEKTLSFTHKVANSTYMDVHRFANENLA